jgi:hypothetical protein
MREAADLLAFDTALETDEAFLGETAYRRPEAWFGRSADEEVVRFATAAECTAFLAQPAGSRLALSALAELQRRGAEAPPLNIEKSDTIIELSGAHPSAADELLAAWIDVCRSAADLWQVLAPNAEQRASSDVLAAVSRRAGSEKSFRNSLARHAIGICATTMLDPHLVGALQIERASAEVVANALSAAYALATNADQRSRVVRNWNQFASALGRKQVDGLIDEVLIPTAAGSKGGLLAVARNLAVVRRASAVRKAALRDKCLAAAKDYGLVDEVNKRLASAGLLKVRRDLLLRLRYDRTEPIDDGI